MTQSRRGSKAVYLLNSFLERLCICAVVDARKCGCAQQEEVKKDADCKVQPCMTAMA